MSETKVFDCKDFPVLLKEAEEILEEMRIVPEDAVPSLYRRKRWDKARPLLEQMQGQASLHPECIEPLLANFYLQDYMYLRLLAYELGASLLPLTIFDNPYEAKRINLEVHEKINDGAKKAVTEFRKRFPDLKARNKEFREEIFSRRKQLAATE